MAAKFFGQFLLEKGLLGSDQLLQALDIQRRCNPMLGEIAASMGLLSAEQAKQINDLQRREDRRFGDIAQSLGLLSAAQVDELLAVQKSRRKLFGEILVEQGMLDAERLQAELTLHQADRAQAMQALELGLADHPLGTVVGVAIDTATKLFARVLKAPCQFSSLLESGSPLGDHGVTARVAISGDRQFSLALACETITMHAIARGFLGSPMADDDADLARDALGEFLNIVMGYVVKDVLPTDAEYRATPPDFVIPAATLAERDAQSVAVALTSPLGPVLLVVGR
jgi:CheY-specific phosphatase CheX